MFLHIFICFSVLTLLKQNACCRDLEKSVKLCHDEEYDRVLAQYSVPDDMLITVNPKPAAFLFGSDFVLWNFSLIGDTKPPFKTRKDGTVVDQVLKPFYMFPNVYNILKELRLRRHMLFLIASHQFVRNTKNLLKKFGIEKLFHERIFMDGTRLQHIFRASQNCNSVFEDMMYFDSEEMAIRSGRRMYVFTICSENGINYTLLNQALRYYQDHRESMFRPFTYFTGQPASLNLLDYLRDAQHRSEGKFIPPPSSASESGKSGKDFFDINDKTYID